MSSVPNLPTEQLLELMLTLKKTTPMAARTILNSQPAIAYALITLMVQMNAINIEVFQKTLAGFQAQAQAGTGQPQPQAQAQPPTIAPGAPHMAPIPSSSTSTPIPAIPPHMHQASYPGHPQYRTATPPHSTPTPPIPMGVGVGVPGLAGPQHPPPQQHQQAPPPPQAVYGGYPVSNGYGGAYPAAQPQSQPPPPPVAGSAGSGGMVYGGYPAAGPVPGPSQAQAQGYPTPPPAQAYALPPQAPQTQAAPSIPGIPSALAETLAAIPDDQKALIFRVVSMTPEQVHALPLHERSTYIQIRATLGVPTPGG